MYMHARRILRIVRSGWAAAAVALVGAHAAPAAGLPNVSPPDSNGFRWATIGNPGNRMPTQQEAPLMYDPIFGSGRVVGAVNYEYRISQTEVTAAQWAEFATAFRPYFTGNDGDTTLAGWTIYPISQGPGQFARYAPLPGREQHPANMSFTYAMRYANWLHNDKRTDRAAFETGAYDVRNFGTNHADGPWSPIPRRLPGARYWVPSIGEWIKAVYYDPNRYGPDQGGYWSRPNGSNTALIPGWPEDGGETSAGIPRPTDWNLLRSLPVGSYPNVITPYGLLDASGGLSEMTDTVTFDPALVSVLTTGSFTYAILESDRPGVFGTSRAQLDASRGFRMASVVPSPSSGLVLVMSILALSRTRGS